MNGNSSTRGQYCTGTQRKRESRMSAPHDLCVLVCSILKWQQQQWRHGRRRRQKMDPVMEKTNATHCCVCFSMYHLERVKKKIGKCETVSSLRLCIAFAAVGRRRRRLLLLHHHSIASFRWSVHVNVRVCVSARVMRERKKNVREIDKQNESNGIEEKKRFRSKTLCEKESIR